jgi:type II secretory pathway component GspD/PulD (secretin)
LEIGKRFSASIALPVDLHGTVTVSLHDVTLDQALTAILAPLGYTFSHKNGIVVVFRSTAMPVEPVSSASTPTVLPVTFISPDRAASSLHSLFPEAIVRADHSANAVIVTASQSDTQAIRSVLQSLDVRNPREPVIEALTLRNLESEKMATRLRSLFPTASFTVASKQSLIVRALPQDLTQIKSLLATLDAPPTAVPPQAGMVAQSTDAVKVVQAKPGDVARAIARQFPRLKAGVSGSAIVLSGSPEDVTRAKTLIAQIDVPAFGSRVTQVYRIRTLDAGSVGDLISRSFPDAQVAVDKDINALSVTAVAATLQRVTDAIAQLDGTANQSGYNVPGSITPGVNAGSSLEVVTLRSAVPSQGQNGYGGADITSSPVIQTLQQLVPGIRVNSLGSGGQIALIGDPMSLRLAKEFLAKIDLTPPLVVLDTEILEIDESVARNLGLLLSQPVISTSFTEVMPIADPTTGQSRLINLGAVTRTPLSLSAQLNLQIQRGTARVLADPRITTLSGRTATIRAGDTIGILTTIGGGAGTYTTTQLQNFQTGVTLDITPIVTAENEVTVALHPVVNSLSGILNGVPQIATRDTQTTVHLRNNQTLIIGGLIQESTTRTDNKIPVLGDLPLLGSIFRNSQVSSTRNELIIVVTPHVLVDGEPAPTQGPALPTIPSPRPLPTLPPGMRLPDPTGQLPRSATSALTTAKVQPTPQPSTLPTLSPVASASYTPIAQSNNAISFGQIPASNYAGPSDPVRIFFASISPAPLTNGARVTVRLISSSNASRASLTIGSFSASLTPGGNGNWTTSFPFSASYVVGQPTTQASLTAYRPDGTSASVSLLISVGP